MLADRYHLRANRGGLVYMNPVFRFVYWNMNYHLEHHMLPMVPYHALPGPAPRDQGRPPVGLRRLQEAYREIIPALLRQRKDPSYHVKRELPPSAKSLEGVQPA